MGQIRIGGTALLAIGTFLVCLCAIGVLAGASLALPQAQPVPGVSLSRGLATPQSAPGVNAGRSQLPPKSFAFGSSAPMHRPRRRVITGRVVETRQWCGGANPSDEILDLLRKETPVANKTLYVRAGSVNSTKQSAPLQFTTDAEGNFKISLPAGDYCIVEESKRDKSQLPDISKLNEKLPESQKYQLSSPNCLEKWWSTCDYNLKVGKQNLKDVVIKFHRTCNPPCVLGGPQPI